MLSFSQVQDMADWYVKLYLLVTCKVPKQIKAGMQIYGTEASTPCIRRDYQAKSMNTYEKWKKSQDNHLQVGATLVENFALVTTKLALATAAILDSNC